MSDETKETVTPESQLSISNHDCNGTVSAVLQDPSREVMLLRARCSNLRHWCQLMLEDPASDGVLTESTLSDLLSVEPEVSEAEGNIVIELLAGGGTLPATHPLTQTTIDRMNLSSSITHWIAERERLRKAFFALYDHLYPGDDLTEEYLLEQHAEPMGKSISELIAEFESELGANQ